MKKKFSKKCNSHCFQKFLNFGLSVICYYVIIQVSFDLLAKILLFEPSLN